MPEPAEAGPDALHRASELIARAKKSGGTSRGEMLLAAMRDPEPVLRLTGLSLLGKKAGREQVAALIALCADPDWRVRDPASEKLMEVFGPEHAGLLPRCLALTRSRWPRVRANVMHVLRVVKDPRALEAAIAASGDSDAHVRAHAMSTLGELGGARAEETIARAIADPQAHSWTIGYGLRALRDTGAVGRLKALAKEHPERMRVGLTLRLLECCPAEGAVLAARIASGDQHTLALRKRMLGLLEKAGKPLKNCEVPGLVTRLVPPEAGINAKVAAPAGYRRARPWTPRICAADLGARRVYVGWSVSDDPGRSYRLERSIDGGGWRELVATSAGSHIDPNAPPGRPVRYRVWDREGAVSEEAAVVPQLAGPGKGAPAVVVSNPEFPIASKAPRQFVRADFRFFISSTELALGDLDNDGRIDFVVGQRNTRRRRAFSSSGKLLWQGPYNWGDTWAHPVKTAVADLDGDGRSEAVCFEEDGDDRRLVILDGASGRVEHAADLGRFANGVWERRDKLLLIDRSGCGHEDTVVFTHNVYGAVQAIAFDDRLRHLWTHSSKRAKAHKARVIDLDGDGRDEIILGGDCLDWRGRLLWHLPGITGGGHADYIEAMEMDPARPGPEIACAGCDSDDVYMLDRRGRMLWVRDTGHAQWLVTGRFAPGGESVQLLLSRKKGENPDQRIAISGELLGTTPHAGMLGRIDWDGDATNGDELLTRGGRVLNPATGKELFRVRAAGGLVRAADVLGDSREEIIVVNPRRGRIEIYTNLEVNPRPLPDRWDNGYWRYRSREKKPFGRQYVNPPS